MWTFHSKFIENDTVGVVFVHGYVSNINTSKSAVQWLDFTSHKDGIDIQHSANGYSEKSFGGNFVDSYCAETNTVYQFQDK